MFSCCCVCRCSVVHCVYSGKHETRVEWEAVVACSMVLLCISLVVVRIYSCLEACSVITCEVFVDPAAVFSV